MTDALMSNYQRLPVSFIRGKGAWLWDETGKSYLDGVSGVAVCALGHAHPEVASAIAEQASTLVHTSNLYEVPLQRRLAERLTAHAGMERAFFCNSGAEANEAALKLARLHAHACGIDTPIVLAAHGSFHGRTLATLAATGNAKVQAGFDPLMPGYVHVPYDDIDALISAGDRHRNVAAVLLEPIQGEGGVRIPRSGYLRAVRELCDERGWLMVLDEVQTGLGRTGTWFGWQHDAARPDVMTLAKSLGNGVPIGACLARGPAANLFVPGKHASTFGGNPLACRAALTVLEVIDRDALAPRAAQLGARIVAGFRSRLAGSNLVREVRGKGLMIGIELNEAQPDLVMRGLQCGVLVNVTAERVLRLVPPLIMTDAEADLLVERTSSLLAAA